MDISKGKEYYNEQINKMKIIRILAFIFLIAFCIIVIILKQDAISSFFGIEVNDHSPKNDAEGYGLILIFMLFSFSSLASIGYILFVVFIPLIAIFCITFNTMKKYFEKCIEKLNYSNIYELLDNEKIELLKKYDKLIIKNINLNRIENIIGLSIVFISLVFGSFYSFAFLPVIIIIFLLISSIITNTKNSNYFEKEISIFKEYLCNNKNIDITNSINAFNNTINKEDYKKNK